MGDRFAPSGLMAAPRVRLPEGAAVLVVGCGYVGAPLASLLAAGGTSVYGSTRNGRVVGTEVHPCSIDLSADSPFAAAPKNISHIVYLVAAHQHSEAAYRLAYVDGVARLLEWAGALPSLTRLLHCSSTGVFAQSNGEWVDEHSATVPHHFSGQLLLEGERLVAASGLPASSVRFSGIYGPGRARLLEEARSGHLERRGPGAFSNRIFLDDCVGALEHLLAIKHLEQIYIASDCAPAEYDEIAEWLALTTGVPLSSVSGAAPPPTPARGNKRCRNDRLCSTGYRFLAPTYREGFSALLRLTGC